MKMHGKLITLCVALLGILAAGDISEASMTCARKNRDVYNLIISFCKKEDLVSPSQYAYDGAYSEGYQSHIWIGSGLCLLPQWIPSYYCRTQFMRACADGGPSGETKATGRKFWRGGCQWYHIEPHYLWNKRAVRGEEVREIDQ